MTGALGLAVEFGRRDLRLATAGTVLGALWNLAQPVLTAAAYTFIFSHSVFPDAAGGAREANYLLYLGAAYIPWHAFSHTILRLTGAFPGHSTIVLHRPFPLLAIPLGLAGARTAGLFLAYGAFVALAFAMGTRPSAGWLLLPACLLVQQAMAFGLGLLTGAVHVFVRDVAHTVDACLRIGFWLTPIAYHADLLGPAARRILAANPVLALSECYRALLLEGRLPARPAAFALAVAAVALAGGLAVFRRLEADIPDRLG